MVANLVGFLCVLGSGMFILGMIFLEVVSDYRMTIKCRKFFEIASLYCMFAAMASFLMATFLFIIGIAMHFCGIN